MSGEPAVRWVKSSLCYDGPSCVEVARADDGWVLVRDGKNRAGPVLHFMPGEWEAFIGGVKNGEFD